MDLEAVGAEFATNMHLCGSESTLTVDTVNACTFALLMTSCFWFHLGVDSIHGLIGVVRIFNHGLSNSDEFHGLIMISIAISISIFKHFNSKGVGTHSLPAIMDDIRLDNDSSSLPIFVGGGLLFSPHAFLMGSFHHRCARRVTLNGLLYISAPSFEIILLLESLLLSTWLLNVECLGHRHPIGFLLLILHSCLHNRSLCGIVLLPLALSSGHCFFLADNCWIGSTTRFVCAVFVDSDRGRVAEDIGVDTLTNGGERLDRKGEGASHWWDDGLGLCLVDVGHSSLHLGWLADGGGSGLLLRGCTGQNLDGGLVGSLLLISDSSSSSWWLWLLLLLLWSHNDASSKHWLLLDSFHWIL